ncbi:DNA cytosine methyltransferase [Paracoccus cavernae]|uniref:DNA cytosine methyltransferase n=1 Tax=Paracoccus cavernae TaxID=1571207 RepID=UPI0035F2C091
MTLHPHLPMIIDSFAGGGGASTGIELALGRSPDVAINHSQKALALHAANHPETLHLDSNIWDVEPLTVTQGRHVGLLWASPDCKHFSKAKGGAPRDRNIRDLAWVVVRWAKWAKPDVICMENVEEFTTWGPVDNDGQPIKEFAGQTFDDFINGLKAAGYRVQWRELRACDYGAPTIRKRWFLVARRDGRPIVWPKATHGDPASAEVKKGKLSPWIGADSCIDWSLPCPSIFDTSAEVMEKLGLKAKRPLADNTLARIARGMKRYVIEAERP